MRLRLGNAFLGAINGASVTPLLRTRQQMQNDFRVGGRVANRARRDQLAADVQRVGVAHGCELNA